MRGRERGRVTKGTLDQNNRLKEFKSTEGNWHMVTQISNKSNIVILYMVVNYKGKTYEFNKKLAVGCKG